MIKNKHFKQIACVGREFCNRVIFTILYRRVLICKLLKFCFKLNIGINNVHMGNFAHLISLSTDAMPAFACSFNFVCLFKLWILGFVYGCRSGERIIL